RIQPRRHCRGLAARQRGRIVAPGPDRGGTGRAAWTRALLGARLRFRRGTLDDPRGDRVFGARAGADHRALSALCVARRGAVRRSASLGDAASVRRPRRDGAMNTLVIDIGGTHVKVLASGHRKPIKIPSGPAMTPKQMVRLVRESTTAWQFSRVS